jgi:predicted DNA binding protein
MKYLELAVREPPTHRNPMHTFVMEHEGMELAQLWNWSATDGPIDVVLFRIVGPVEPYTDALEEVPFVAGYETARVDAESFFLYVEHETRDEDAAFREPFLEERVLTIPPIEYTADGEVRMDIIGRAEDVQAVVDGFPDEFGVRVDRIREYGRGVDAFASLLTDRQREAVSIAVDLGYYDVPRTSSLEAVAAELECAPSTASDHLQKAEARLARQVLTGT